ncbi:MAG TPA: 50S ribosomal protein L21 [Terriglobales bacterium]|jgi:large subunit ribosomal protein L21
MYAVIRAGGKQYRVAPGDVIRVENVGENDGHVSFGDVLAVSGSEGHIAKPGADVHVSGEVLGQGRGGKILVFHYKKKKQYKKLQGHRQGYTSVRITEIAFDGQKFTAPALPKKEAKPKKVAKAATEESHATAKSAKPAKKSAVKKAAPKKSAPKKKK